MWNNGLHLFCCGDFFLCPFYTMPYMLIRSGSGYGVKNTMTNAIHSYHTTMDKAKAQIRLLTAIAHGVGPKKGKMGY